ncbi:MAG: O-antigen ligase family protein [Planctomycetota bacterium]
MREISIDQSSHWQSPDNQWDWFFLTALVAALVFALLSFGVVDAWSELMVVAGAAVVATALALRVWLDDGFRLTGSWTLVPLAATLVLIFLQLLPLPGSLVGLLSPESSTLRETMLQDLGNASGSFTPLSMYPLETRHDLRMAVVFVVVFLTAASVFRSKLQIKRALWCIFIIGCVESALALLQILTLSKTIHWMFAEQTSVVTSGSFVNHSHFCQFVNLTIGAGVALVLVRMKEDSRRERTKVSRLPSLQGDRYLRPLTGVVLCAVAVFTSLSRNGALSLLLASSVCAVLLYRRGVLSVRGWILGAVPWCVALLLFLTSFDTVYERFSTLDDRQAIDDRWKLTAGTIRAWVDFPLFGAGLGTHEYLFPLYDETGSANLAEHADNDWAQLLEEFGLVGATAVVAFVASVFSIAFRLMLGGRTSLSTAAFGLSFGLLAVAWHSLSDFGQHLPGIFILTAVTSGLIVAISRYEKKKIQLDAAEPAKSDLAERDLHIPSLVGCMLVAGCAWWMVGGALAAAKAEAWADSALAFEQRLESQGWIGDDQDYIDLLLAAEEAVRAEPTNVKNGYLLNQYRWQSMSQVRNKDGAMVLASDSLPLVQRVVDDLSALRVLCPIYGPTFGLEGDLRLRVFGDPTGAALLRQAARLTPHHAPTSLAAARLAQLEGRHDEAAALFSRTVEVDPQLFSEVARLCLGELQCPELAIELGQGNDRRLWMLSEMMESGEYKSKDFDYGAQAQTLRSEAVRLLRRRVEMGEADASEVHRLANVEKLAGRLEASIELLRQALKLDYGNLGWRLDLARALLEQGEQEQALREAKILLRLNPESVEAAKIVDQIDDRP